jgi:hypothetical protein
LRFSGLLLLVCALASAAVLVKGALMLDVDPDWAKRLCVAGAIGVVVFALLMKLPAEWRASAAVTTVGVALTLIAANFYFAFRKPDRRLDDQVDAARRAAAGFDHRTVLEVVRDRNAAGKPSVPALRPYYALLTDEPPPVLPLSGISTATTVLCNESGEFAIYQSDELGFNNPRGLPDQIDVVIIGDSFVHGSCVPPGKDLTSVLRAKGYSAINLGMGGSGPMIELGALVEFGLPRSPKVVVMIFGGNDFADISLEMLNETLIRYVKEDGFTQRLRERQPEVDAYWKSYLAGYTPPGESVEEGLTRFTFREILTLFPLRSQLQLTRIDARVEDTMLDTVIERARRLTEAKGARFFLVTIPYWELLDEASGAKATFPELTERLSERGIDTADFLPALKATADPFAYFPLRLPGHFNEEGYRLLGDFIEREILEKTDGLKRRR